MRVTPHSTLTISTCVLALLSQLPSVHSAFGGVFQEGRVIKSTFSKEYVEKYQGNLFLSNIRWGGGNDLDLSFARVDWDGHDAFMKCDRASSEVRAFNALKDMKENLAKKKLEGVYAIGQQNVMEPLHQFAFTKDGPVDINLADRRRMYVCHLYSFVEGVNLAEYLKKSTPAQAYIAVARILPDIIKGLLYLYNAGILYHDTLIPNTVLQLDSNKNVIGAKIIDLDRTIVFKKEQGWQRINLNDQEYLSPNPSQRYNSCNDFKLTLTNFLLNFVFVSKVNPFTYSDVLPESDAIEYLNHFNTKLAGYGLKQKVPRLTSASFDAKAAIPAILRLVRAMYTMWQDNFSCTSPIRALEGLPPRPHIPMRPNSPSA